MVVVIITLQYSILDKNSGILTEFSAYPHVLEYPSISAPIDNENLAISHFDPFTKKVYSLLRVDEEWTSPPGVGGYTGQYPTQNHLSYTSNTIHMVYTKNTQIPYKIDYRILFYPSQSITKSKNTVYYRRGDIDLSRTNMNIGDSLLSGIFTIEVFPDTSKMNFIKGPNINNEFLNSFPFVAGLEPLSLRLKLQLARFQFTQNPPPGLLDKEIFEIKLVDVQNNSKLHSVKEFGIKDLLHLHQMGDSLDVELNVPISPYLERNIALKTNFSNLELNKAVKWTHVYRTMDSTKFNIPLQDKNLAVQHEIPAKFRLKQNYPNPFNPTSTIAFDLPEENLVELEIYDITGKRVRTLVNSNIEAGSHQIIWDGHDDYGNQVSSGMYFYRIRAGSFQDIKKMVLFR